MSAFADDYLFYLLFVGVHQVLLAAVVAVTIVPLLAGLTRRSYGRLLRHFALLNVFLLAWGGLGDSLWLRLTDGQFSVADDCPVWVPFLPFGRWILDSAAGSPEGWQLHGNATLAQLQWTWAAIAVPVWVLSVFSVLVFRAFMPKVVGRTLKVSPSK
ncbi:MAG TPA: hypothetical protein VF585_10985 [Chthoniobacterales bacterium]|jgi:hypothetical protein